MAESVRGNRILTRIRLAQALSSGTEIIVSAAEIGDIEGMYYQCSHGHHHIILGHDLLSGYLENEENQEDREIASE